MTVLKVYYFVAMDTTNFCGYIGLSLNHQFLVTWILKHLAYPPPPRSILLNFFFFEKKKVCNNEIAINL